MEYGVCSQPWVLTEQDCQGAKAIGVKYVRLDCRASDIPLPFDQMVQWIKTNGMIPIALLKASKNIPASGPSFDVFVADFGQFVYDTVLRYKGQIELFEIWNEQNNNVFWNDPEATLLWNFYNRGKAISKYVTLLKEAYTRAKQANPNCKIISGGLGNADAVYTQGMYDAGVKGYFDYFGIHPYFASKDMDENYNPDDEGLHSQSFSFLPKIKNVRAIMEAHGDFTQMFVTELGVGCDDYDGRPTTPEMQANRLTRALKKLTNEYTFVKATCWYVYRTIVTSPSYCYSIVLDDGTLTPMYYAYKKIIEPTPKRSILPLALSLFIVGGLLYLGMRAR